MRSVSSQEDGAGRLERSANSGSGSAIAVGRLADLALGRSTPMRWSASTMRSRSCCRTGIDCSMRASDLPLAGGSGKDGGGRAIGPREDVCVSRPDTDLRLSRLDRGGSRREDVHHQRAAGAADVSRTWGQGQSSRRSRGSACRSGSRRKASCRSSKLELLVNGSIVVGKEASGTRMSAIVETEWTANESCWIAAR